MNIRAKIYGGSGAEESILRAKQPKGAKPDEIKSVSVPRREARRSNSRIADRYRLSGEKVRITHGSASHDAALINLSAGGAMIRASFEPNLWDRVDLHFGEHGRVECAVCWIRDDQFGLEFAQETRLDCPSDEIASVLREVITRSFPDSPLDSEGVEKEESTSPEAVEEAVENQRSERRHPLIWTGTLHFDFESTPARIRNISATGAMIECSAALAVGDEPVLELNEEAILSTTVQWTCGNQVGLSFHTPFDMRLLALSKPQVAPPKWERPTYLNGSAASRASRLDRLTVNELGEQLEGYLKH